MRWIFLSYMKKMKRTSKRSDIMWTTDETKQTMKGGGGRGGWCLGSCWSRWMMMLRNTNTTSSNPIQSNQMLFRLLDFFILLASEATTQTQLSMTTQKLQWANDKTTQNEKWLVINSELSSPHSFHSQVPPPRQINYFELTEKILSKELPPSKNLAIHSWLVDWL